MLTEDNMGWKRERERVMGNNEERVKKKTRRVKGVHFAGKRYKFSDSERKGYGASQTSEASLYEVLCPLYGESRSHDLNR